MNEVEWNFRWQSNAIVKISDPAESGNKGEKKMLKKMFAVKIIQFLLVSMLAEAPAMAQNLNAELDAWKAAFAESQRITAENAANYAADRAEWHAAMADANRPMTKKEKIMKVVGYVADKAVDHISIRAGVRAELGRAGLPGLPTAFAQVNAGVEANGAAIAANGRAITASEEAILASARENLGQILSANTNTSAVVAANGVRTRSLIVDAANFNAGVTKNTAAGLQKTLDEGMARIWKEVKRPCAATLFGGRC